MPYCSRPTTLPPAEDALCPGDWYLNDASCLLPIANLDLVRAAPNGLAGGACLKVVVGIG